MIEKRFEIYCSATYQSLKIDTSNYLPIIEDRYQQGINQNPNNDAEPDQGEARGERENPSATKKRKERTKSTVFST